MFEDKSPSLFAFYNHKTSPHYTEEKINIPSKLAKKSKWKEMIELRMILYLEDLPQISKKILANQNLLKCCKNIPPPSLPSPSLASPSPLSSSPLPQPSLPAPQSLIFTSFPTVLSFNFLDYYPSFPFHPLSSSFPTSPPSSPPSPPSHSHLHPHQSPLLSKFSSPP